MSAAFEAPMQDTAADGVQVSAATQAGLALPAGRGSPYIYQVCFSTQF